MRVHNWPERLFDYIESRREEPFAYGTHDCCQFAAHAVEAITENNPAKDWHYANEIGAGRLIVEAGGIDALVTQALGEPVHPAEAGRGDVVMAELDHGMTIGVCLGRDCVFAAEPAGVTFRPRRVILKAWKVQ
jgi:hypothetical protein